jgi:Xaa-Pro aminopeptidase
VGKASERFQTLYRVLLDAQMAALDTVKNGVEARQVDRAARDVLQKADLESYFKHSTGHGLGLEIHEYPSLSQRSGAVLYENMVVTIEPGIYIPGWGGIRIEDTVVVQSNGCEIITRSDKGLLIV